MSGQSMWGTTICITILPSWKRCEKCSQQSMRFQFEALGHRIMAGFLAESMTSIASCHDQSRIDGFCGSFNTLLAQILHLLLDLGGRCAQRSSLLAVGLRRALNAAASARSRSDRTTG